LGQCNKHVATGATPDIGLSISNLAFGSYNYYRIGPHFHLTVTGDNGDVVRDTTFIQDDHPEEVVCVAYMK